MPQNELRGVPAATLDGVRCLIRGEGRASSHKKFSAVGGDAEGAGWDAVPGLRPPWRTPPWAIFGSSLREDDGPDQTIKGCRKMDLSHPSQKNKNVARVGHPNLAWRGAY